MIFLVLLYNTLRVTATVWGFSSAGRASALQAEGHRFEPCSPHQQKTHFCLPTKVRFLNDVCLRQMMTASTNDVRCANDVCLTAHWANIASLRNEVEQHHFERSEKHHIAAQSALHIIKYSRPKPTIFASHHESACMFASQMIFNYLTSFV